MKIKKDLNFFMSHYFILYILQIIKDKNFVFKFLKFANLRGINLIQIL